MKLDKSLREQLREAIATAFRSEAITRERLADLERKRRLYLAVLAAQSLLIVDLADIIRRHQEQQADLAFPRELDPWPNIGLSESVMAIMSSRLPDQSPKWSVSEIKGALDKLEIDCTESGLRTALSRLEDENSIQRVGRGKYKVSAENTIHIPEALKENGDPDGSPDRRSNNS